MTLKLRTQAILAALAVSFASLTVHAAEAEFERDPTLPIVRLAVAVKTGAVADPAGMAGLGNFVAKMLLRGTRSRTKEQIDLQLDQLGSSLEVESRAESLIIRGSVLSSNLGPYLTLLKEIIEDPSFNEREIKKLQGVVSSERLAVMSKDSELSKLWMERTLFEGHPYGISVEGTAAAVQRYTRDAIKKHYEDIFGPETLVVVGAGDADPSRISEWARDLMSKSQSKAVVPLVPSPAEARSRRLTIVDKPGITQNWIQIGQLGVKLTDPDYFALYLGNHSFGGDHFGSRLMMEIRAKRGWSYGSYANFRHGTQPRSWQFYLFPATKDGPAALKLALSMLEELRDKGITAKEFEFSRKSLVNGDGFRYDTPAKRVENRLLEVTLGLPKGFMESYAPNLSAVTRDQVNQAFARFLAPDRTTVVVVADAGKQKKELAEAAGVPEAQVKIQPYQKEE